MPTSPTARRSGGRAVASAARRAARALSKRALSKRASAARPRSPDRERRKLAAHLRRRDADAIAIDLHAMTFTAAGAARLAAAERRDLATALGLLKTLPFAHRQRAVRMLAGRVLDESADGATLVVPARGLQLLYNPQGFHDVATTFDVPARFARGATYERNRVERPSSRGRRAAEEPLALLPSQVSTLTDLLRRAGHA